MINSLKAAFSRPLPGQSAQFHMAPAMRQKQFDSSQARNGAVLILLYEAEGDWHFPVIRRPDYPGIHAGQISLPGGKRENNESLENTALRETEEEIGIARQLVTVLGELSPLFIPPSNFLVHPFVGYMVEPPTFKAQPEEVEEIFTISMQHLQKEVKQRREARVRASSDGSTLKAPSIDVAGHQLWGATAMMLSEFVFLFEETKP